MRGPGFLTTQYVHWCSPIAIPFVPIQLHVRRACIWNRAICFILYVYKAFGGIPFPMRGGKKKVFQKRLMAHISSSCGRRSLKSLNIPWVTRSYQIFADPLSQRRPTVCRSPFYFTVYYVAHKKTIGYLPTDTTPCFDHFPFIFFDFIVCVY